MRSHLKPKASVLITIAYALALCPAMLPAIYRSSVTGPQIGVVEVQGVRIQYVDWGGRGEPLVLVPARCETPFVFGDLAPLLLSRFRVLGLTAHGCGACGHAHDDYRIDVQIRELVGFLDALRIERATFAGHSASGGKVVRLARQFPRRVSRIVTFDIIYTGVPEQLESRMSEAIASSIGGPHRLSLESYRREFEAWELGTWSSVLERDFQERTEISPDRKLRYRRQPEQWQRAFVADVAAGHYFETVLAHPALFFVAHNLDYERILQFPAEVQRELRPMAQAVATARAEQIARYLQNGPHVRVVWLKRASHYLFVDRARDVASRMLRFLEETTEE